MLYLKIADYINFLNLNTLGVFTFYTQLNNDLLQVSKQQMFQFKRNLFIFHLINTYATENQNLMFKQD